MKIGEIPVTDALRGKAWGFAPAASEQFNRPMEEWDGVREAGPLEPPETVIYSGLNVFEDGEIRPILLLKVLRDVEYGGDYCEFVDGRWRQLGLTRDPDARPSQEYISHPSPSDPSFDAVDHDYRKWHQDGFAAHVVKYWDRHSRSSS